MKKDLLIGFIGQGFIGKNMADDFQDRGFKVVRYSKEKYKENKEKIKDCDFVFIAVPTPSTPKGFDDSILRSTLDLVGKGKTAIIKSTIKVGSTEKYQKLHPDKYIIHSPEFLTEKNAKNDTKYPPRNIIGVSKKSKIKGQAVLDILPKAKYEFIIPSKEAELIKYMGNNFLYIKVIYANIIYNFTQKMGIDYDLVSKITALDSRIGPSHLQVKHNSGLSKKMGRGAGGHCFIKDMAAFIEFFSELGIEKEEDKLALDFLKKVVKLNQNLLINSRKDLDLLRGVYKNLRIN